MKTQQSYQYGKIVGRGAGGFLNPPTHPEHTLCVKSLRGDMFSMSLSAAVEDQYLDPATKARARELLAGWVAPAMDASEVQGWILQVLGYFKGCYQGENGSWNAGDLVIDEKRNPLEFIGAHAGVNLIRKYYPQFTPTAAHFAGAYWGGKTEVAT